MEEYDVFKYQAKVANVVDGDTQDFTVDLGFRMQRHALRTRLIGVDTHEIHFVDKQSEEYKRGMEEKQFVEEWLQTAEEEWDGEWYIYLDTEKDDRTGKYGRYLADVIRRSDGASLVDDLLAEFDDIEY